MTQTYDVLVIGAGIFGATAAVELNNRGYKTAVFDPGPIPHPLAASTDISKVIRMEYGTDKQYMAMIEAAIPGWRHWNEQFDKPLYHETGVLMLTRSPMTPGGYEHDSYHMLQTRNHQPERLNANEITRRFPAWKPGTFVDGFYHRVGGYAESGRVVTALLEQGKRNGLAIHDGQSVNGLVIENGRITGIRR